MIVAAFRKIARRMLPRTTLARIYRRWVREYLDSLNPEFDPGKKTILAFNHFYDQDLSALSNACRKYNLVIVDAPRLVRGAKLYFRDDVIKIEAPYESEVLDNQLAWRKECDFILDLLQDRFGIDLMLSGSDIYWWVREFIHAGHKRNIKTVVIDKEGTVTPLCLETYATKIAECAPFISDHIYVWSDRQRRYWNRAGVPGDRITILGQPRSDLFFSEQRNEISEFFPKQQPIITFFSYMDDVNIFPEIFPELDEDGLSWQTMKKETHDEIIRLAAKFKNFNFVIKTHPQQPDFHELRERYQSDNLVVIGGPKVANELIQRSELIIAFQTTALIEAMFMNKPSIYTCWDENYQRLKPHCIPFHDARGIVIADSFSYFVETCERFLSGDRSDFAFSEKETAGKNQFVDEYFYKPDGHVCQRFYETVGKFIK